MEREIAGNKFGVFAILFPSLPVDVMSLVSLPYIGFEFLLNMKVHLEVDLPIKVPFFQPEAIDNGHS